MGHHDLTSIYIDAGDLGQGGSGRVWNILKEEPTGFANELQVESERRVKNNLEGFGLSTRKEGRKKGTVGKP